MKKFLILIIVALPYICNGQQASKKTNSTTESSVDNDKVYDKVEIVPQFPGGPRAWERFLENYLDGTVAARDKLSIGNYNIRVNFTVHRDGPITDINPVDIPKACIDCRKAIMELLVPDKIILNHYSNGMEYLDFHPGQLNGRFVSSKTYVIIPFSVTEQDLSDESIDTASWVNINRGDYQIKFPPGSQIDSSDFDHNIISTPAGGDFKVIENRNERTETHDQFENEFSTSSYSHLSMLENNTLPWPSYKCKGCGNYKEETFYFFNDHLYTIAFDGTQEVLEKNRRLINGILRSVKFQSLAATALTVPNTAANTTTAEAESNKTYEGSLRKLPATDGLFILKITGDNTEHKVAWSLSLKGFRDHDYDLNSFKTSRANQFVEILGPDQFILYTVFAPQGQTFESLVTEGKAIEKGSVKREPVNKKELEGLVPDYLSNGFQK